MALSGKKIYIASPFGFTEAGRFFMYERIIPFLANTGIEVIDPWKLTPQHLIDNVAGINNTDERIRAWQTMNMLIGENNRKGIEASDGLIAVLDGCDVDSGTAAEIGYAFALGKKIAGYRSDFRNAGDNEGSAVNIQVEYFIFKSGGKIFSNLDELLQNIDKIFI